MACPLRAGRLVPAASLLVLSMQTGFQASALCATEGSRSECSNQGVCICNGGADHCLCECDDGSCRLGPTCQYIVPDCHVGGWPDAATVGSGPSPWLVLLLGTLLCCCGFAMMCRGGGGSPAAPAFGAGRASDCPQPAVEMTSAAVPLVSDPQVAARTPALVAGALGARDLAAMGTVAPAPAPATPAVSAQNGVEVVPWSSTNPLAGLSPEVLEHAICRVGVVAELQRRGLESDGSTQELALRLHRVMEEEGPTGFGGVFAVDAKRELVGKTLPPRPGIDTAAPIEAVPSVPAFAPAGSGIAAAAPAPLATFAASPFAPASPFSSFGPAAPATPAASATQNGVEVLPWEGVNPLAGLSPDGLEYAIRRAGIVAELDRRALESSGDTEDLASRLHQVIVEEGPHGFGEVLAAAAARELVMKTLPPGTGPCFVAPAPAGAVADGAQAQEGTPLDAPLQPHGPSD